MFARRHKLARPNIRPAPSAPLGVSDLGLFTGLVLEFSDANLVSLVGSSICGSLLRCVTAESQIFQRRIGVLSSPIGLDDLLLGSIAK